jgi:hypothetical protein
MLRRGVAAAHRSLHGAITRLWRRLAIPADWGVTLTPTTLRHAAWNTKVMGSALARQRYALGLAGPGTPAPAAPIAAGLGSRLCRARDVESPWLHHWCHRLGMAPIYHRKVWEDAFVVQALWEAGMLAPGRRGLGFAVGRESLPSLFAAEGAQILASDLDSADARGRIWRETGQHGLSAEMLYFPHLVTREAFDERVRFQTLDMTRIPPALATGGFDFLWSVCAFEHLGSIEAGLDYVLRAMACLRPGGVAVHTTEFNLMDQGSTLARGPTVLYQRHHIETLVARLQAAGHAPLAVDFDPGDDVLDAFIDLPPFARPGGAAMVPDAPHLRLSYHGHPATSIGLIIRAGG